MEAAENMRLQAQKESREQNEAIIMKTFEEKFEVIMSILYKKVSETVINVLQTRHTKTGIKTFILGGSWASAKIAKEIFFFLSNDDEVVDKLDLVANDVDVNHGSFTQNTNKCMGVDFGDGIEQFELTRLSLELITRT